MKYKTIKIDDIEYPEKLRRIKKPPKELYAIGNIDLLKQDSIAVIGTRKITNYGIKMAEKFSKEIALRDIPIVSGMALGTDSVAHNTALKYNSPTIAVLGTGFNNIYPPENLNLFKEIINSNGLVITEIEENGKYNSKNFPRRNRIVSGLSECVLVIEAAYRSGTSITVKYAKEQNKKVFAIPGGLDNIYGVGVNNFIKEGAILLTDIDDLIKSYPQFANKKRKTVAKKQIKSEYREIYNILKHEVLNIEEISKRLKNKNIRDIANTITLMELDDLIVQEIGLGYKIKEENGK